MIMRLRAGGASRTMGITEAGEVMIKIIIVEDKKVVREGLAVLLGATEGIECLASYSNCEDMLERLTSDKPDVILMDIGLPGMSGIEGTREVKKVLPDTVRLKQSSGGSGNLDTLGKCG